MADRILKGGDALMWMYSAQLDPARWPPSNEAERAACTATIERVRSATARLVALETWVWLARTRARQCWGIMDRAWLEQASRALALPPLRDADWTAVCRAMTRDRSDPIGDG